jgi:hypothetical protein
MSDPKAPSGQSMLRTVGALMPSGLGHFLDLLAKGSDAIADAMKARDEKRWKSFLRAALEGDVFAENAEYMTGDDLLEMYRMCLNDIEEEKAALYGRLATAIATGKVPRALRFPLMLSLTQLTHDQVQRMRKAYIADVHELVADGAQLRRYAREFLGGNSDEGRWDLDRMTGLHMVKDKSLTEIGKTLVSACFPIDDLQPTSIGECTWKDTTELEVLGVTGYGRRDNLLDDVENQLTKQARDHRRKVRTVMMTPEGDIVDPSPLGFPCFVVLVGSTAKQVLKCLEMVRDRVALGKMPIFASPGPAPDALRAAFPRAKFIENEPEPAVLAERVLETVKAMLTGIGDTF